MRIPITLLPFALAAVTIAQQPAPAPEPKPPADPKTLSTLTGQVLNAVTGEPIRRVNLALRSFGTPGTSRSMGFGPGQAPAPFAATTDAEGKFTIEKVEPGTYRLGAERQGFVRQEYGARGNSMMGTTINVPAAQTLSGLNMKLTPQAIVRGKVLDDEGEPLARVQVQLLRRRYMRGKQQLVPSGGGMTLDTGEFRIADIAPGRYWISAVYRNRAMMMYGEAPARNTTGKPEEEYVTTYYPSAADETGARPVDLAAGQELSGLDIPLRKARVYRVRGKVSAGTEPFRNLRVLLMPRERTGMMMFGGQSGMVKEDGTFEIAGVPPGSYYAASMVAQGMMSVNGKTPVDVAREDVENVTITMTSAVALKGTVRLDGTQAELEQAKAAGTSLASIHIQLAPLDGFGFNAPNAAVKADGTFEMAGASADRFRIGANNLPPGTWIKSVRAGDREILETGIDLAAGPPGPLEIVLGLGVGQLSGAVRDGKQQPAPGAMVTLLPDPMKEDRNDRIKVSTADQTGQFNLQSIAPGEYRIYAWEDIEPGRYMDPEFLKQHETSGSKVVVKTGGQGQVNLVQVSAEAMNAK